MTTASSPQPTILTIFGATGDVVAKKVIPAIFRLHTAGKLPPLFRVIGFSRRELSDLEFRTYIEDLLKKQGLIPAEESRSEFTDRFSYIRGNLDVPADYQTLAHALGHLEGGAKVCVNSLFYLAVPPDLYEPIFANLSCAGLTTPCGETSWTRILVEKPIGMDSATSERLDLLMSKLFQEQQIYRIEHYLAKEMIRNLLAFRFSNNLFEGVWDRSFIEDIHLRLWESIGVESRGNFYDKVGTLRDVGQNHLLQMLALATMEAPTSFSAEAIRTRRAELLATLQPMEEAQVPHRTFRAQHEGYRSIIGVAPDSRTETFFAATTFLDTPRWKGVPIRLEAGKCMSRARKEIDILIRHPSPCLCPPGEHYRNRLTITLEPVEGITVEWWSKKPGHGWEMEKRSLDFVLRQTSERVQYTEEYQKVILDAIHGDQTLFVSTDELRSMWRFVDPIQSAWQKDTRPLPTYAPDSDEPVRAADEHFSEHAPMIMQKTLGLVGLGKMGANLARNLHEHGWEVVAFNRTFETTQKLAAEGIKPAQTLGDLVAALPAPRTVWLMVPAGQAVDEMLFGSEGLMNHLEAGDVVIEGGNSFYKDDAPRAERLATKGINYMDVGVSGGPGGARTGACLMIGGARETFERLEPLFRDASLADGYRFFEGVGAGHFVKMVHNGIEYGMMQALAEGFHILKTSPFNLNLTRVAELYDRGSVIESRLTEWLTKAFKTRGEELQGVSGTVAHTGEGAWTVDTAKELGVPAANIEQSLQFRKDSVMHQTYTGQVLSALREQFGGHAVTHEKK